MTVPVTYFNPLSFQQAAPVVSGMQAGANIASTFGQNALQQQQIQQAAIQNRYLPQTLAANLQGLNLGNTAQGIKNQYLPQNSQAAINLQNSQAGLAGSQAATNQFMLRNPVFMSGGIGGQIGQTGFLEQSYPGLFGNGQQNGGMPPISSNNGGMTIQPTNGQQMGTPGNYATLPGGSLPQQQLQQLSGTGMPNPMIAGLQGLQGGNQSQQPNGMSPLQSLQMSAFTLPLLQKQAQTNMYNMRAAPYNNMTTDMKNQVLAQANTFGYTPDVASQQLASGKTLADLAIAKGLSADPTTWAEPNYAPTNAQRTWYERRNASSAELQPLQDNMTAALAPYSRKFDGYSPAQIADSIKNDNPDQQAKYYAAMSLSPDFQALKLKIMGGEVNAATMNNVLEASMMKFKALNPTVSPEVFTKTQQYTQQWLNQALQASNKAGLMPPGTAAPDLGNSSTGQAQQTPQASKFLNGQTYHKINGQWYAQ